MHEINKPVAMGMRVKTNKFITLGIVCETKAKLRFSLDHFGGFVFWWIGESTGEKLSQKLSDFNST